MTSSAPRYSGRPVGPGQRGTYVRRLAALAYSELQWAELAVESQLRAVELAPGGSRRRRWELVQLAGFHFQWAIALERLGLTASSGKLAYRTQLAAGRATLERLRSIAPMSAGSPDTTAGKAPHDLPDGAGSVLDALLNGIPATEASVDRLVASAATPGLTTGALALIRARTARVLRLLGKFDESARMAALAEHTQLRGHLVGWIVDEVQFQSFTTHLSQADPENHSGATYVASINLRVWNHEQDQIDDFRSRLEEMQQRAQIADEP